MSSKLIESSDRVTHVTEPIASPPSRAKSNWTTWAWVVVTALSFMAGRFWIGATHREHLVALNEEGSASSLYRGDAVVVTAQPVALRPIQRTVDAVGTLHGFEELTVSSKVEGRVVRIHYDLSSVVKPGDILLELDATDARLAVDQAERSLQAELAKWGFASVPDEGYDLSQLPMVVSSRLRFDLAKSRLDRMLPLETTKSISQDDLEQAKSESQITESDWKNQLLMANSAAAVARLRAAELAIAKQKLRDCEIRVPTPTLTGNPQDEIYTVSERLVSEGTLLRPGTEVFRLVLGRTLKLRLPVPEVHSSQIEVDQKVLISTSSMPEGRIGRVAKISPSIERTTRTFIVEVEVPNEDGKCKPGSFSKASIQVGVSEDAATVPLSALYSLAGINKIFLVHGDRVQEIQVSLGEQTSEWVEIASPAIPLGARVVTSGQRMLSDGAPIIERKLGQVTALETSKADASKKAPAGTSEVTE